MLGNLSRVSKYDPKLDLYSVSIRFAQPNLYLLFVQYKVGTKLNFLK